MISWTGRNVARAEARGSVGRQARGSGRRRGVTLLEMVLATSLLVLLSSMTYVFYVSSLKSRDEGMKQANKLRLVRVVLDRMATEIRQVPAATRDFGVGLVGDPEAILLTTRRVPRRELAQPNPYYDRPPDGEYDHAQVQYRIARHPDVKHDDGYEAPLGLARIESKVPRPESPLARAAGEEEGGGAEGEGGEGEEGAEEEGDPLAAESEEPVLDESFFDELFAPEENKEGDASLEAEINWEELYAPEVHYIRFCYYDGYSWWDEWHVMGESPLPQLVQVTIGFGDHPPLAEDLGQDRTNEEFCECLNRDPPDCLPLGVDEYSITVRVAQADPLFRSRVAREGQHLLDTVVPPEGEEGEESQQ